jgi:hypothetical protein
VASSFIGRITRVPRKKHRPVTSHWQFLSNLSHNVVSRYNWNIVESDVKHHNPNSTYWYFWDYLLQEEVKEEEYNEEDLYAKAEYTSSLTKHQNVYFKSLVLYTNFMQIALQIMCNYKAEICLKKC